jgi:hypothetical protein
MRSILAIVALFGLCLSGQPALAAKRVALVIGNSAYSNADTLSTPVQDAKAIAGMLRDAAFDVVDLQLDVDKVTFRKAIAQFQANTADAEIAVIFFGGYGIEIYGTSYLLPVDAKLETTRDAPDQAIALDRLVAAADDAKTLGAVFLDADRNEPFSARMRRDDPDPGRISPPPGPLLRQQPTKTNTLISYANKAGAIAPEVSREHSVFTAALLKHLTVPGLDIRLALGRVRSDVLKATDNRQEPFVYGALDGDTVSLAPARSDPIDPDNDDTRSDYELVKKIGTRKAFEVFLGSHRSGYYADLVRGYLGGSGDASAPTTSRPPQGQTNWGDDIFIRRQLERKQQ